MIQLEVKWTPPKLYDIPYEQIAHRLLRSIQINIMVGGRPAWAPLKSGSETALVATGRMFRSITEQWGPGFAEAGIDSPEVYMQAQQYGARIPPVEGKLMVFNIGGNVIFTYRRKGFDLPARPFVMFQDQDVDWILRVIPQAILEGPSNIIEGEI